MPGSLGTLRLAMANLFNRPLRSMLLGAMVALFGFALFVSAMVSLNLQTGIYSLSERLGADLLVVPDGDGKKIENVLLRSVPTTFYLPEEILGTVQSVPGVAKASGQLFISSLEAQCCSVKVQLIGIDMATDFVVAPWLKTRYSGELKDDEVIVGNYIVGDIGERIRFYGKDFKIVAQLEPTGMGFDASVFMTVNAARQLGKIASPDKADTIAKSYSSILVRAETGTDPMLITDEIIDRLGLGARVNFVYASALMSDTATKLRRVVDVMMSAAAILWGLALIILLTVFFFAANERVREFATLRAMGATKLKVLSILLVESLFLGLMGSLVGVGLGAIVANLFSPAIAKAIELPYLAPGLMAWFTNGFWAVLLGTVTAPLAALPTLWKFSRNDIYAQMREGR